MGVKPFYYYLDDDMFVFGTEIKALFCVDGVPRELNENRLSLFFTGNDLSEKKTTFYKNINSLSHSHFILVYKNKHENEKYWELNHDAEIRLDSDNDYAKEFEKIFAESVKCRLRSWTPLGIMLSGGIDSSSVTCMVNKIFKENNCQNKVHTFSYVFDDYPNIDERDFIESVLNIVDVESHYIICDDISPLIKIEEKIKFHDQPLSTYNIAMIHKSNKMINKNGIRVLLTGEGGDQVVSHGTNYLEELLCHFKLNKFLDNISNISDLYNISKTKLIFNTLYHIFHFYVFKLKIFLYDFKYSDDILNKKFLKKTKLNKLLKKLELYNIHNEKQSHYYFIKQGLQYGFEMLDQDSSIYNIELRHPFFDKRLIEFCYGIPSEMKIKYGFSRYVLRIGMENILPRKIQWRLEKSKMGFVGANNFLLEKKIIEKTILDQDNIIQEYIDLKKLQKAFNASLENKTAKTTIYIWRITLFYYWLLNRKKFNL
jgi:asparagine synthase (glutamine-hydrolysing)